MPRAVGAYLRTSDHPPNWWRVVAANCRLISPDPVEQARRLAAEGITVVDGKVVEPPARPGRH